MSLQDILYQLLSMGGGTIDPNGTQKVASGGANGTALPPYTTVMVVADADSHIKLGQAGVSAGTSDFFLPAKVPVNIFLGPYTYIGVTGGNVYISQLIPAAPPLLPATGYGA